MKDFTVGEADSGQRLDKYCTRVLPNASFGFLCKMLRKKNITLNGKKADGKEILHAGDLVAFFFSEETFSKFAASGQVLHDALSQYATAYRREKGVTVIYEDADVIFLNKPAGMLTQKAKPEDLSLNEWLIGYLLAHDAISPKELAMFHPSVCNRLDRNTSGLVLCGKTRAGSQYLSEILRDRSLHKYYRTFVSGQVAAQVELHGYLYKDESANQVTILTQLPDHLTQSEAADWQEIRTRVQPLFYDAEQDLTALEIELLTGKTHQIRAHLASIGHPIIGDRKYGGKSCKVLRDAGNTYQLLHAYRVVFPAADEHSTLSGKVVIAPLPKAFTILEETVCRHGIREA